MNQITVTAPAKINLTLDVLRKRADGYHDIESVMHQVNLCDQVSVTPTQIKLKSIAILMSYLRERTTWPTKRPRLLQTVMDLKQDFEF